MPFQRKSVCAGSAETHHSDAPALPSGTKSQRKSHHLKALAAALFATSAIGALPAGAQLSALHASGRNIVNANNTVVPLRGVNLGGLFVIEQWMAPLDSGYAPGNDTYGVMATLDSRFGVATEQSLINTYQDSWITDSDFDNIKNAGFNVVRVPVWWGQFYSLTDTSSAGWRSDAFRKLDMIVNSAASRGIYVIIDLHGAVGGQSTSDSVGRQNQNQYFYDTTGVDQAQTAFIWWKIADHYKGNTTIAGFDLLNEPAGNTSVKPAIPPPDASVIAQYNNLYSTVRGVDPNRMIIIEGTWRNWDWDMLPSPSSQNWTNVVYSMHAYGPSTDNGGTAATSEAEADKQVTDFNNHSSWNVPDYIGEFTAWDTGASAWQYMVNDFNNDGMSWSIWTYKATAGGAWGYYSLKSSPPVPNVYTDSSATIASDWQQFTTANAFALNSKLGGVNGGGVNTGSGSGGTTSSTVNTSAWYNVVNQQSGQCLDAAGWGTSNGTVVQQYTCGSQQTNQEWQFQSQGSNTYSIVNRFAPSQTVDVANVGTSNGSLLQTWTYGGGTNQKWTVTASGTGFIIVGVGSGKCVDDPNSTSTKGTQMQIWGCDNTPAQVWTLNAQP